jgi:hypothetical protein
MVTLTKKARDVFAGLDGSNNPRQVLNSEAVTWGTEIENATLGRKRNLIINGDFDIWQRGTSQSATGIGSADRWNVAITTTGSASQSTDVPADMGLTYSMSVTTDDWNNGLIQTIEDCHILYEGKQMTLTAWVKGPVGKTAQLSVGWVGNSPMYTFTGDWQEVQWVYTYPANIASTSGYDHSQVIVVRTNGGGTLAAGENVLFAHISLVEGDASGEDDPFTSRHIQQELALCHRYYFEGFLPLRGVVSGSSSVGRAGASLPVEMRSNPTVTVSGSFYDGGVSGVVSSIASNHSNTAGIEVDVLLTSSVFSAAGYAAVLYSPSTVTAKAEI